MFPYDINLNILLIGKSGTGKKSFARYLFDEKKFRIRSGNELIETRWLKILNYDKFFFTDDIVVNIYNSVALASSNFEEWNKELDAFLLQRHRKSASDYYKIDLLFYTINATSDHVEENEIQIINKLCSKYRLPKTIVLTHCDVASQEQITRIESAIKQVYKNLDIIRVSSVSGTTHSAKERKVFGKNVASQRILSISYKKDGKDLMTNLCENIMYRLSYIHKSLNEKIDKVNMSIYDINKAKQKMNSIVLNLDNIEFSWFYEVYRNYYDFMNHFSVEREGKEALSCDFKCITDLVNSFSDMKLELKEKLKKKIEELFDSNWFQCHTFFQKLKYILLDVFTDSSEDKVLLFKLYLKIVVNEVFHKAFQAFKDTHKFSDSILLSACLETTSNKNYLNKNYLKQIKII